MTSDTAICNTCGFQKNKCCCKFKGLTFSKSNHRRHRRETLLEYIECGVCSELYLQDNPSQMICSDTCRQAVYGYRRAISYTERNNILIEQDFHCARCDCVIADGNFDVHHIHPIHAAILYKGDINERSNLEALCRKCHIIVHGKRKFSP